MIDIRKLAALDIALHGPKRILAEFGLAVALAGFAGVAGLVRGQGHSPWTWYFLGLALNYLTLLGYAVGMLRDGSARAQAEPEISDRATVVRYSRQQLWLLVPGVAPLAALWQELRRRT